jgi:hypothetical protein
VLLKNGRIMTGHASLQDGRYRVALANGEISLRADEVAAVCRDLAEAYTRQRAGGQVHDIEHRIKTALWCIDQGLFSEAQHELESARRLDPRDRRLGYVERRLQVAQTPKPEATAASRIASQKQTEVVSHEELERLVRNLPKGTPETFAEVVQPLLLSRCGTSNCHGLAASAPLRLLRPPSNKSQASRITQRNLHAALQFIDHDQPQQSPLLRAAGSPHAGNPLPLLNESQHAHLTQLAEWIADVTQSQSKQQPVQPATITFARPENWGESQLNQIQRPAVRRGWANPVQTAGFVDASSSDHGKPDAVQTSDDGSRRSNGLQRDLPLPSDELDPGQFNRRFFREAPDDSTAQNPTGQVESHP